MSVKSTTINRAGVSQRRCIRAGHPSNTTHPSLRACQAACRGCHSCLTQARVPGILAKEELAWRSYSICLKRENLEPFILDAIDFSEDVNKKTIPYPDT